MRFTKFITPKTMLQQKVKGILAPTTTSVICKAQQRTVSKSGNMRNKPKFARHFVNLGKFLNVVS